jgi:hypothetical protein
MMMMTMMSVEQSVEGLAVETEVFGENLPWCCFVYRVRTRDSEVGIR